MELIQAFDTRRSIRNYQEDATVTLDQIKELIRCSGLAPSWKNSQTGRYYVALSPEKIDEVKKCLPEFNIKNCQNAKALVVTCFETKRAGFDREGNPVNECGDLWGAYDLGLQNENFVLRARDMSLDTLIMGIRDEVELRRIFDIPESQMVMAVISVGVRSKDSTMPARKPVEDIMKVL